jgi:excisionase family DNA binding protein
MKTRQADFFSTKSTFAARVEARISGNKNGFFKVPDVAEALEVSNTKIREWIESGRIPSVNMNLGCEERPMYRLTFEDVMAFAKSLDAGI